MYGFRNVKRDGVRSAHWKLEGFLASSDWLVMMTREG